MIRTRFKKVLLVAPDVFQTQLLTDYKNVKHVSAMNAIFPTLFETNPEMILFDFDFMGPEMEKTLRRIKINKFYSKLKIYCYKSSHNIKTDSLLKALGVDMFIYKEDLEKVAIANKPSNSFNTIIDSSIMKLISSVSN